MGEREIAKLAPFAVCLFTQFLNMLIHGGRDVLYGGSRLLFFFAEPVGYKKKGQYIIENRMWWTKWFVFLAFKKVWRKAIKNPSFASTSIWAGISLCFHALNTAASDRSDRSRDRSIESIGSIDSIIFRSFKIFGNSSWRRCGSNGPKIIKIRAILAIFWPFEDFCDFRFGRFGIPFGSVDIAFKGRGGPPWWAAKSWIFVRQLATRN